MTQEPTRSIDLSADLGEHENDGFASDFAMLGVVSSASIACGAHAGSPEVMRETVAEAYVRGVSIGAHPGYPDREGFGRREPGMETSAIIASVEAQIELLAECCAAEGARMTYVKPHGALYNRAVKDAELARLLSACIARFDSSLAVLGPARSMLVAEAKSHGLKTALEGFIDRAYLDDGTLVPRNIAGAIIEDSEVAAARAVIMARGEVIASLHGSPISLEADSLCVHGDSANAVVTVRLAREALEKAGFAIRPFAR